MNFLWMRIWRRNVLVWQKLLLPSLLGNFGEPLLLLVALGYGLGPYISNVGGMSYLAFLASGIVCSSAMNTASFEGMYSAFTRMQVQQTWTGEMTAPLDLSDIVLGEVIWGGTKSLISATAILIVAACLGVVTSVNAIVILPITFLVGCCFNAMALIVTGYARNYDFFMYYNTLVITPMLFTSGVFFPLDSLPHAIKIIALGLPLSHAVQMVRPLMVNGDVTHLAQHVLVIFAYCIAAYFIAVLVIKKRLLQ